MQLSKIKENKPLGQEIIMLKIDVHTFNRTHFELPVSVGTDDDGSISRSFDLVDEGTLPADESTNQHLKSEDDIQHLFFYMNWEVSFTCITQFTKHSKGYEKSDKTDQ